MIGVIVGWLGTTGRIISAAVMVALEDQSQWVVADFQAMEMQIPGNWCQSWSHRNLCRCYRNSL